MILDSYRRNTFNRLPRLLFLHMAIVSATMAQEERIAVMKPNPPPALARQLHLTGVVKVKATISTDGQVKDAQVTGGHPLLGQAVLDTLKQWKYAPSKSESSVTLEFHFQP